MNEPQQAVLQVRDLSAWYGKVAAVSNASISVAPGSIVTVIGGNGAGKSTLLNAIMGVLSLTGHSTGSVQYHGGEIASWVAERRDFDGISRVPGRRDLIGSMSVTDER